MTKVATFTLCKQIGEVTLPNGESAPALMLPMATLRPPFIPTLFSFGVCFGLIDLGGKSTVRLAIEILDPEGTRLYHASSEAIKVEPDASDSLPEEYQTLMFSLHIQNISLATEGLYKLKLYVDGTVLQESEVPVYISPEVAQ